jgi:hypothetical protein
VKISGYVAGSIYKKFYGSNMSQMNRAAVENASNTASSYGDTVFTVNVTQSQGVSELAVKQYAARLTEEAKAKLQGTSSISSLLQSLGVSSS